MNNRYIFVCLNQNQLMSDVNICHSVPTAKCLNFEALEFCAFVRKFIFVPSYFSQFQTLRIVQYLHCSVLRFFPAVTPVNSKNVNKTYCFLWLTLVMG